MPARSPRAVLPAPSPHPAGSGRTVRHPAPGLSAAGPAAAAPRRSPLFLPVVLVSQLMVVLDATIVNVALPHIQSGLHFSTSALSWVLNAYVLTFGGLLMLGARSGDLLGRRRTFIAGLALFTLASMVGGLATTGGMLLAARAAQGVGAALVAPSSLALLTAVFPEGRERLRAIALFTTVSTAGAALGLVAGGMLVQWASWRWVMFVNVPFGVAAIVAGRLVVPETARRSGRFDLAGAVTSTLGMSGVVLGLVEAGTTSWSDPRTWGSLAGGVALLGLFLANEARAAEPILPLRLLADRTRGSANLARGFSYAGMYGMFFFLTQYLQDVRDFSPITAGFAFLPMPVTIFLSSQLASRVLMERIRPKQLMLGGIGIVAAGLVAVSFLRVGTPIPAILAEFIVIAGGMGICFVSLTTAALAGVAPEDAGAASGLVNVSQQLGAALGLATLVTVFDSATRHARVAGGTGAGHLLAHGLDVTFAVAVLFALVALAAVALGVREDRPGAHRAEPSVAEEELETELAAGFAPGFDAA